MFSTTLAQTIIKGHVTDGKLPLVGAVITCLDKQSNQLTRGGITDKDGNFNINVDWNKEWIRVSYVGYKSRDFWEQKHLSDTIRMDIENTQLGEVTVQAKSIVTQKEDRLVFHVANSLLTKGNNAMQLLRFTPMMKIEGNQVNILGKNGMQLYINGKKSSLSATAIQGYLQSLPAEKINRIEIITTPGSEYRTGINEGILNIILKKDETQGWKGLIQLNDEQAYYNIAGGNIYLDYQKGKFSLSASGYGNRSKTTQKLIENYDYIIDNLQNELQTSETKEFRTGGGYVNLNYQINQNQSLGGMLDISYGKTIKEQNTHTLYRQYRQTDPDSTLYTQNNQDNKDWIITANLNYRLHTNKKGKLAVDVDYVHADKNNQMPISYFRNENTVPDQIYQQLTDETTNSYTTKIEYEHTFTPMNKLKAGVESYLLENYNNFQYGSIFNNEIINDTQLSNCFDTKEYYIAPYATYTRIWNPQFISIVGIRTEVLYQHGIQHATGEHVNRHEFAPVPTFTLAYTPNKSHQLVYALTTKKLTPSLPQLNPFRYYISPTVYIQQDPYTKAPLIWIQSLQYTLKRHYVFSLNYITGEGINSFRMPVEGGYTRIITRTFGRVHLLNAIANWNNSFWNDRIYLNASLQGTFNRSYGHFQEYNVDVSNFSYNASLDWQVQLSQRYGWKLDGNIKYRSKKVLAQEHSDDWYTVSLGLTKQFKNGISAYINGNNLINKDHSRSFLETETYNFYSWSKTYFRSVSIGVSIPFGRKKVSGAGKHTNSSSSLAKDRLKAE